MKDEDNTKEQFLNKLSERRQNVSVNLCKKAEDALHKDEGFRIAHRQLIDIIDFFPDATFVIDINKKVIAWNRAIEEMTGIRKEDILGKGDYAYSIPFYGEPRPILIDLISSDDALAKQQYKYVERKGNKLYAEAFVPSLLGKCAVLWSTASPLFDNYGNLIGAIQSIRDITKRKHMENELRKHRDHLEELVKKRTGELKEVNKHLLQEIAERMRVEEALRESEEKYRTIFETTGTATVIIGEDTIISLANAEFENLSGYSKEELEGKISWTKFIAKADLERTKRYNCLRKTHPFIAPRNYEFQFIDKQGNAKDILAAVSVIAGTKTFVASFLDITQRKRTEDALRESEDRYRRLVELSPNTILVHSEGRIVFLNKAGAKLFGAESPGELIGKPLVDYMHSNYKKIFKERAREVLEEEGKNLLVEEKYIQIDGTVIDVEVAAVGLTFLGKPAVQVVVRDITKRKRNEEALRTAQQQLQDIIEFLPDPTFAIDSDKKIIAWNRAVGEMMGVHQEDIIGKSNYVYATHFYGKPRPMLLNLIFADDKEIKQYYNSFERKGDKLYGEVFIPSAYGGKGAYLWGVASPLYDYNGNPVGSIETIRDITEHRLTVEALRLSEERFAKAFNASPNLMAISTYEEGHYVNVNNNFLRITGYNREEIIGCSSLKLNAIWQKPEDRAEMIRILDEKGKVRNLEIYYRTKTGEVRNGLYSAEIIELDGQRCILSVLNDITEHKQLKNEMARLDRLHLVGEMAAGIGHEIRNPMTTVRGFLQMLGEKKDCLKYKEYFDLMIEELDRANSIITEFLSLAKNKAVKKKEHNLNLVIRALFPLIRADAIRADKYVKLALEDIPDLFIDEKEIRQLILNLVRNGLEAMSSGGNLTIETFMDKGDVVLAVKDQGEGIGPDVLVRLGTPFFTTKDNGTGLGLAVCYSIAARHNATIKVETSSKGSAFYVRFSIQEE